eukprot:COSAG01_NODE_49280_length_373_cov_1.412409_1_plen_32_part_01
MRRRVAWSTFRWRAPEVLHLVQPGEEDGAQGI